MRLTMIGTGYVGLVSGACFSEFGVEVTCVDKDIRKIEDLKKGNIPIYEPGLEDMVGRGIQSGCLKFTTNLKEALNGADAVFIAVGTPSRRGDGHADLSYVFTAAEEIADNLSSSTVVVTKSTVPVGTGRKVQEILKVRRPDLDISVASNPEFLREGSAIEDFMRPDRVVVGAETEVAQTVLKELYRPLYLLETPIVFTNLETAELIKYAANGFLATKIAFINEISDICEATGADVQAVAKGIGLDKRIGSKFLHVGPGYGGSCFPKDTLALVRTAQEFKNPLKIVEAVVASNDARKKKMAVRIRDALGGNLSGKTIGILGVTFKPNTDDMRESPSLTILPLLQEMGAVLKAYDPVGMKEAQKYLNDIAWEQSVYDALKDVDAAVILTEWNEFRALDFEKAAGLMKNAVLIDFRNIYALEEMKKSSFTYYSLGRPIVRGQKKSGS